jgi:hypothetical protein
MHKIQRCCLLYRVEVNENQNENDAQLSYVGGSACIGCQHNN